MPNKGDKICLFFKRKELNKNQRGICHLISSTLVMRNDKNLSFSHRWFHYFCFFSFFYHQACSFFVFFFHYYSINSRVAISRHITLCFKKLFIFGVEWQSAFFSFSFIIFSLFLFSSFFYLSPLIISFYKGNFFTS